MARQPAVTPDRTEAAADTAAADTAQQELIERLLASAMGLPRVCVLKSCRRAKRCFGTKPVCLEHHRGLAKKRWRAAAAIFTGRGSKYAP